MTSKPASRTAPGTDPATLKVYLPGDDTDHQIPVIYAPAPAGTGTGETCEVRRADNARRLGWIQLNSDQTWAATVDPAAFRGTGIDDTGDPADQVPPALYHGATTGEPEIIGVGPTPDTAAYHIAKWLVRGRAPAVGYGPSSGVRPAAAPGTP